METQLLFIHFNGQQGVRDVPVQKLIPCCFDRSPQCAGPCSPLRWSVASGLTVINLRRKATRLICPEVSRRRAIHQSPRLQSLCCHGGCSVSGTGGTEYSWESRSLSPASQMPGFLMSLPCNLHFRGRVEDVSSSPPEEVPSSDCGLLPLSRWRSLLALGRACPWRVLWNRSQGQPESPGTFPARSRRRTAGAPPCQGTP